MKLSPCPAWLATVLCLAPIAAGDEPLRGEHTWILDSGPSLVASYAGVAPGSGQVLLRESATKKLRQIDYSALCDADEDRLAAAWYRPAAAPDREKIPVINQGDYGNKAGDCLPSAYACFFLWWDETGYLAIPKRRRFDDKADWLHDRFSRLAGTRNTAGTSHAEMEQAIGRYCSDDLENAVRPRIRTVTDVSAASLAKHTGGPHATVLTLSIYRGDDFSSTHAVSLVEADEKGFIRFITWGKSFRCRIGTGGKDDPPHPSDGGRDKNLQSLPVYFLDPDDVTDGMKAHEVSFRLEPNRANSLRVLTPHFLRTPIPDCPLPPDPEARAERDRKAQEVAAEQQRRQATDFKLWTCELHPKGIATRAGITAASESEVTLDIAGKPVTYPREEFSAEDQGLLLAWQGLAGQSLSLDAGSATYQLAGPVGTRTFTIDFHGHRARIRGNGSRVIIDAQTGHFISDREQDDGSLSRWTGRYGTALAWTGRSSTEETSRFPSLPFTGESGMPGRRLPGSMFPKVKDSPPAAVVSRIDAPAVLTALRITLEPLSVQGTSWPTPNVLKRPWLPGSGPRLGPIAALKALPVSLSWKLTPQEASLHHGEWTLKLTSLRAAAPDTPIEIPAEVLALAPDSILKTEVRE